MQSSIRKSDGSNTLQLAPVSASIGLAKKLPNFDTRSSRNCFHILDLSDNIKLHYVILCLGPTSWQVQLTSAFCGKRQREAQGRPWRLLRQRRR